MTSKQLFTFNIWKKALRKLYKEVYSLDFFMYIDCLQYFQENNTIYIYAYNNYMRKIVKRRYFDRLKAIIHLITLHDYTILLKTGLISLDWDKRVMIKKEQIKSICFTDITAKFKYLLFNENILIIYIKIIEKYFKNIDKIKMLNLIKNLGLKPYASNMKELLQSTLDKIAKLHDVFDVFILFENNHNDEFQKILINAKNIEKIDLIMVKKKIIIVSEIDLIVLKDRFIKVVK